MNLAYSRFAALSFAALLASVTLAGQSPEQGQVQNAAQGPIQGQTPAQSVLQISPPADRDCPVSMRAQQRPGGDILVARDGQRHPLAQRIHLILGDSANPAKVVAATVTVRGTNGKPRAITTVPLLDGARAQNESGMTAKTLDLRFDLAGNGEASTDLSLSGFTSVTSIRLDSLTFADGTIWVPANGQSCRTAPDPFMLVSSW